MHSKLEDRGGKMGKRGKIERGVVVLCLLIILLQGRGKSDVTVIILQESLLLSFKRKTDEAAETSGPKVDLGGINNGNTRM